MATRKMFHKKRSSKMAVSQIPKLHRTIGFPKKKSIALVCLSFFSRIVPLSKLPSPAMSKYRTLSNGGISLFWKEHRCRLARPRKLFGVCSVKAKTTEASYHEEASKGLVRQWWKEFCSRLSHAKHPLTFCNAAQCGMKLQHQPYNCAKPNSLINASYL